MLPWLRLAFGGRGAAANDEFPMRVRAVSLDAQRLWAHYRGLSQDLALSCRGSSGGGLGEPRHHGRAMVLELPWDNPQGRATAELFRAACRRTCRRLDHSAVVDARDAIASRRCQRLTGRLLLGQTTRGRREVWFAAAPLSSSPRGCAARPATTPRTAPGCH
jgi:hypothetical protein